MGGKLFGLPRMSRAEYLLHEHAVRTCLDDVLGETWRIPRYYGDKADFGDMDVIVPDCPEWPEQREEIVARLGITRAKATGRLYSTVYEGLQTDFFAVDPQMVECMYNYMSFNDLGNLLGRICRRFNLKYGEDGLTYTYRRANAGHYKANLLVTQDFVRICAFLKLDHAQWLEGFPTLTSLYEWVIASPYFSVAPYLDDLSGTMAGRTKDRPTIQCFIDYLREGGITARPPFAERDTYLPTILEAFPEAELDAQIAAEQEREERANVLAAKFNGKLVMRLRSELSGAALAAFIVALKRSIPDFEAYIIATPANEIEDLIRTFQKE